jgi:2-amino-4-hydroxy-6-hydroxymethyldihydropteridine diphosphokinase
VTIAYLALGSNLGDRAGYLERGIELLQAKGARVLRRSSVIETEPFGVLDQPRFLNQVLEVEWPSSARELLAAAQAVEAEAGRTPTYRWGPRELDVDILLFDSERIDEPDLKVPHPGLWDRDFVLRPLAELRPDILDSRA